MGGLAEKGVPRTAVKGAEVFHLQTAQVCSALISLAAVVQRGTPRIPASNQITGAQKCFVSLLGPFHPRLILARGIDFSSWLLILRPQSPELAI